MRPYHSPSSAELGKRCRRAWYYRYVLDLREPEITWAEIEAGAPCTDRQRPPARGKAMHDQFERWFHGVPFASNLPGLLAQSGSHLVPNPARCLWHTEAPIGDVPTGAPPNKPQVCFVHDGIRWAGYRDLLAAASDEECERRILLPGWTLYDYKSTANIAKYAKDITLDLQCNLYALATMVELGLPRLPVRWVYIETRHVRRAAPVDAIIERDAAAALVASWSPLVRELDTIRDERDAPQNPKVCGDYGGCEYHQTAGGPCNARRSFGGLVQARVPKGTGIMALTPEQKAKFDAMRAAPVTASVVEVEAEGVLASEAPSEPPPAAPAPTPAPRGRPRKAPNASAPASGIAAQLAPLQEALAAAEAAKAEAEANIAATVAQIRELVG